MEIKDVIMTLITADRCGEPNGHEGSVYIQISEELVQEMIECLKEKANEPVIKVFNNIREINELNN